jgi:hypothetical protein
MIEEIQKEIDEEFKRRKIRPYSLRMNLENMILWSDKVSKTYSVDVEGFETNVKEVFWAAAALQLNVGHIFISLRQAKETGGKKRTSKNLEIPENYGFAELHCWYHLSNCWESVYRTWERVVSILIVRFTPSISKKFYFTDYTKFLERNKIIFKSDVSKLDKYFKHWSKVASQRNEISHGNFNPFRKMEMNVRPSGMITLEDSKLKVPVSADYSFPNLKQEVDSLLNSIEETFNLINTLIDLCELQIQPNKKIMWDADGAAPHI